jgi:hypothetical protein
MKKTKTILLAVLTITMMVAGQSHSQAQNKKVDYFNLGGTVFGDTYPMEEFYATLIYNYSDIYLFLTKENFDTLGYYYYMSLPNGNYMIKAEPLSPQQFVPTYYGGVLHWQDAAVIELFSDQFNCDIQLISGLGVSPGTGCIHGMVNSSKSGNKNPVPGMEILLFNTLGDPLTYRLTNGVGEFDFSDLAYGTYLVYPEMEGKVTTPTFVTLDADNPTISVWISMYDHELVATMPEFLEGGQVRLSGLYPTPSNGQVNFDYESATNLTGTIKIVDLSGKEVCEARDIQLNGSGTLETDLSALAPGSYYMELRFDGMAPTVKKILIQR